ncbi:MAG TPA: hypothetical protein VMR62_18925 [Bryobacteraceae bacterium]|nr:hypothetical protein [Bryobacteraceae bacterium]
MQQTADAIRAEMRSTADAIRAEMRSTADAIRADFRQEMQRTAESILNLIVSVSERIDKRFDAFERRFEAVDNRLGRLGETVGGVLHQVAGFTRWAEQLDRSEARILAIQEAQQHFLDLLAARTTKLEQPLLPPQ